MGSDPAGFVLAPLAFLAGGLAVPVWLAGTPAQGEAQLSHRDESAPGPSRCFAKHFPAERFPFSVLEPAALAPDVPPSRVERVVLRPGAGSSALRALRREQARVRDARRLLVRACALSQGLFALAHQMRFPFVAPVAMY